MFEQEIHKENEIMKLFSRRDPAEDFIIDYLSDMSMRQYLAQEKFEKFRSMVITQKKVVAAKEYYDVTGASMAECSLVVDIARQIMTSGV